MGSEHYCLRWNNHQSNLLGVFSQLLRDESLVDVTLACSEGHSIRAHKVVLSACSSYFQTLFVDHPSRHPIVILKDVRFSELRTLIEFMYKGEVNVEYCQLSALLKTAESLKVKGLAEMTREYKQEPEQTEPTELVGRRQPAPQPQHQAQRQPSRSPSVDENERLQASQSPVQNLRVCRSPPEQEGEPKRPPSPENTRNIASPVAADCGPSDMSIHSNSNNMVASCSTMNAPIICTRLPSPLGGEPLPGPSNMPPVQQVPLVSFGGSRILSDY
ncbi:BTB and/or BASP1 domain containing protein [Asbolus verrucosus]|uniref:BTB and/or BASP1 domain containing protein n=1 Tax=Asbolus verrucosus TaxID=1661398 RepID=A0A482VAQ0_ASBVE|nr:BTB and/or BASP1 domain containing protein [Asbolus verrucosus]